jgi:hypothetical protein
MDCILHIGAGKCGSSSLQKALLLNGATTARNCQRKYEYMCIDRYDGVLLRGDKLKERAQSGPFSFYTSCGAQWLIRSSSDMSRLRREFMKVAREDIVPILSWEDWLYEAPLFIQHNLLRELGLNATVIVFVRPQISWINAAWWQWGAWSNLEFGDWLEAWAKERAQWAELIEQWKLVPGVGQVEVRLATRNVVSSFSDFIGATIPSREVVNPGLDADTLRFIQRNDEFHEDERVHKNMFILGRRLSGISKLTPWVIPRDMVKALLSYFREGNERLLSLVPSSVREEIEADARWWEAEAYADRKAESPAPQPAGDEELTCRALHAVIELDEHIRHLEARLRH